MNCLYCNKPLQPEEESNGWHTACIRRFFGTRELPAVSIDSETLRQIAIDSTVTGVQKKLSLHLLSDGEKPRLTLMNYPNGYILKPQVEEYRSMPEAEQLVMNMAEASGITTVPHALIRLSTGYGYITKRIDRPNAAELLAMEDFCQLDGRLTRDKYNGSYERCAKLIRRYSAKPQLDISELFMRLVFSYITGNSDMHLKNFSLLETGEGSGTYRLSPAYDLLPVNVLLPTDKEEFALTMNGKKQHLHRKDFLVFAENIGLSRTAATGMIGSLIGKHRRYLQLCRASLLPEDMKQQLEGLMADRIGVLTPISQ